MNLLFVVNGLVRDTLGGTEALADDVAKEFAARGNFVTLLAPGKSNSKTLREDGVLESCVRLEQSKDYPCDWRRIEAALATELDAVLRNETFDVIHLWHFTKMGLCFLEIDSLRRIPLFATLTDYSAICADTQLFRRKLGQICHANASSAECAMCRGVSTSYIDDIAQWRQRNLQVFSDRVEKIYCQTPEQRRLLILAGIPDRRFASDRAAYFVPSELSLRARSRAGRPFRFGFLGRISAEKGLDVAVNAFTRLRADLDCELVVYGISDPDEENSHRLRSMVEQCPGAVLREPVPVKEIHRALDSIDALLVPSLWLENHPIVLELARAIGLPVLASLQSSMEHLSADPGIKFVAPGDIRSWADAMRALAVSDAQHTDTMNAARNRWRDYIDLLESNYVV